MPYADSEDRKSFLARNKEKHREYAKAWRAANKEHVKAKRKEWVLANPEKERAHRLRLKARWQNKIYYGNDVERWKKRILNRARQNAKARGLEYNVTLADIHWPEFCPVLGIRLNYGCPANGHMSGDGASIDRTDSKLGYVKGNVVIMSWRANRIKCDATAEEALKIAVYLQRMESNRSTDKWQA